MAVHVCLLGVISASTPAGQVTISGYKQQALLAMLALVAPKPVSDDRLIDQLWGDEPPGNPANALQAQVSHLRRVLGREVVARESSGYSLRVEPADVDALKLDQLVRLGREAVAAGEQQAASALFEEAVALVRGPPLEELIDQGGFAQDAATWLNSLVLDAHEGLVETSLAVGRHAEVVKTLRALVAEHPLRERFHAQLVVALYRCGRQSEALRAYGHVREVLAEELGLDPGPELQALERAVLSHDPALAAPVRLSPGVSSVALPMPLTSFVGRHAELAGLLAAIDGSRLVTIVGPAGVGKTRLVLETAAKLATTREVWYVELAPVIDGVAVPEAVASSVGARDDTAADSETTPRRPNERTIGRLRDRGVVLILDNCEHVIDAVASCARTLLAGCPSLTIVATSREPLALDGELQLALDPLGEDDAVRLFTDRARSVQPLFQGGHSSGDLLELCRKLDGLPLAIELAAARAKTLPVPEITRRLEHRFELLKSANRHLSSRHRALSAAIDASYELLFEDERRAFRTLAVFAGGVTVDAAQEVCGPDALDILTGLVDRSMVVADTSGREARFRMLESLREYGLERLRDAAELDEAVDAHAQWCTALAERADVEVRRPDQLRWLDRLDAEHDNLRAALSHLSIADPARGLRLIGALIVPWFARNRRQEARHWAEACLAATADAPPTVLALALAGVGFVPESGGWTGQRGELESELALAQSRQRRAIKLCTTAGDEVLLARCQVFLLSTLARTAAARIAVDAQEMSKLVADALEVFERVDDHYLACLTHTLEAIWCLVAGDVGEAASAVESARTHAGRSGDGWSASNVEWLDGMLLDIAGDARGAYRHVEQSLRRFDELGTSHVVIGQAESLAHLADRMGEPELAAQWRTFVQTRSGASAGNTYDGSVLAAMSNQAGLDARRAGDFERAKQAHLEALAWWGEIGVTLGSAFTASCLGFLESERGDPVAAAHHHARALDEAATLGDAAAMALAFEGAASTFADGKAGWAAEVLGAARALHNTPETHRADVTAIEKRARAELGDDAFDAAVARGAAWNRADAVAAARAGPPS